MFISIEEYFRLDKENRQSHLILSEECTEIGGHSREFRALLAHYLKTTIPSGRKIFLCHACHNGRCSNVKHLYWGTIQENNLDAFEDLGSISERAKKIHGDDFFKLNSKIKGSKGGRNNARKPKSEEHKRKISESLKGNRNRIKD